MLSCKTTERLPVTVYYSGCPYIQASERDRGRDREREREKERAKEEPSQAERGRR